MRNVFQIILSMAIFVLAMINVRGLVLEDIETGQLQLTEDQQRELIDGKIGAIEIVNVAEHQYIAVDSIYDTIINRPPTDCWKLFNKFMEINRPIFKKWANENCRSYIGCWCCPYGRLCITYIIKPDPFLCLNWKPPIFKEKIPIFEPQGELIHL